MNLKKLQDALSSGDTLEVRGYLLDCLVNYGRWDHRPEVEGYRKDHPLLDLVVSEMIWNEEMVRRRNRSVRNSLHGGMPPRIWELPSSLKPKPEPKIKRTRRGFRPSGKSILVIDYLMDREICEYSELLEALHADIGYAAMRTYIERLEDCGLVEVGPFWQMSPVDSKYSSYKKNELCLRATVLLSIRMKELGMLPDEKITIKDSVIKKLRGSLAAGRELRHAVYFSNEECNFLLACIQQASRPR